MFASASTLSSTMKYYETILIEIVADNVAVVVIISIGNVTPPFLVASVHNKYDIIIFHKILRAVWSLLLFLQLITDCIITSAILFQFSISLLPPFHSFSIWLLAFHDTVGCWMLVWLRFAFLFFVCGEWRKFFLCHDVRKKRRKNFSGRAGNRQWTFTLQFISSYYF